MATPAKARRNAARAYAGPVEDGGTREPSAAGDERVDAVPRSLWERVQQDPVRAPEHIALAASERFAPSAARWAARLRHRHPSSELAGIARRRHVRISRLEGAAAGLGGALTVVPDLGALAWIQGRMVFYIAAAYDLDPADPMRPAELLALQGIYRTPDEAREALDGLGRPLALQYLESRSERERALASRLLRLVGRTVAKRTVLRVAPILSAPISSTQNARATDRLGERAIRYYGSL